MQQVKIDRAKLAVNMVAFAAQKPNFSLYDYNTYSSFMSDYRHYKKDANYNRNIDKHEMYQILCACTDEQIQSAFKAFSGRLQFDDNMELHYIASQYYPTEYQAALRSVIEALSPVDVAPVLAD